MSDFSAPYGPDYNARMTEIVGCPLRSSTVIETNVYMRPYWQARKLSDGRIVWIINRNLDDIVKVFANFADWRNARRAHDAGYPDPETGRPYAS